MYLGSHTPIDYIPFNGAEIGSSKNKKRLENILDNDL